MLFRSILSNVSFRELLRFHNDHRACATMCVREFSYQVPYGVVSLSGVNITDIAEKPASSFFINSGIYVLSPEAFDFVPANKSFTMPNLFDALRKNGRSTIAFPVFEYWMDIGSPKDLEKAKVDFHGIPSR